MGLTLHPQCGLCVFVRDGHGACMEGPFSYLGVRLFQGLNVKEVMHSKLFLCLHPPCMPYCVISKGQWCPLLSLPPAIATLRPCGVCALPVQEPDRTHLTPTGGEMAW